MNRRDFLAGSTALAGLAACSPGQLSQIPGYVTALDAIGQEAEEVMPELQAAASAFKITIPDSVGPAITSIISVANGVSAAATASEGKTALQQIETAINSIAPVVVPIIAAMNPAAGAALGLIVAALPAVEALVDFAVTELTPQAKKLASNAPTPASMSMRMRAGAEPSPAEVAQPYLDLLLSRHPSAGTQ